jgi:CRP-like cAMP-binding protein
MKLENFIKSVTELSDNALEEMLDSFKKVDYPKGTQLLDRGKTCQKLFYLEKGLARSYYYNEKGKDITVWFFTDNNIMVSAESFFQQKSSLYDMELLEDSNLYYITFDQLQSLFNKYHCIERFGRLLAIKLLTQVVDKLNAVQFQTAKERYQFLIQKYPDIAYRAPLGHIASYLGITQETLSRIRAEM